MLRRDADRNLLFGINALQNDFITRDALIAAMNAWALEKHQPLGDILVERNALNPDDRDLLNQLIDRHLARHGGDPAASLAAISSIGSVADDLRKEVADPDVIGSLDSILPSPYHDPYATRNEDPYATRNEAPSAYQSSISHVAAPSGVRFTKVRKHAAGNLGVVYVAHDEELNRHVALKEIKERNADEPYNQAKFLLEAEVTGGLEHPGIVPVYGLGHHEDGRPFYAMRFIRGKSLLDAIKRFHADESFNSDPGQRSLELQKLLRRFTDICNAIAYAHSRGVLHRDLKPDNVMVGKYGETLVVDWGLAKALGRSGETEAVENPDDPLPEGSLQPSSAGGLEATQYGSLVGTPAYMSPEQAAGRLDLLGPASDIYGLGATLYHLLVGRPSIEAPSLGALLDKIQAGNIIRPRAAAPRIDPALEAICLKAMALKPEARYATPRALADDLERWIAGEPVTAYTEPWSRRARRWAKRNRTAVSASAAAVLVGLIGLGAVAIVQTKARNDLDRKNVDLTKSEAQAIAAVRRFGEVIVKDHELKNTPALEGLRKRLLNEPLVFFRDLRERLQADRDTRPETLDRLANASFDLSMLTNEIGNKQDALQVLREAQAIQRKLSDESPSVIAYQTHLAQSYHSLGHLMRATGQPAEALEAFESALKIQRRLADNNPSVNEFQSGLADCHNSIGVVLSETGRPSDALKAYELALTTRRKLADNNPSVNEFQSGLASSYNNIGNVLSDTGKPTESLKAYESALKIQQRLADNNPSVNEFQNTLAISHNTESRMAKETYSTSGAGPWRAG